MGVSGLLQLLKSIQRPCHIKSFAGLTLGFDAYCWLHPGTIPCAVALATGKPTTRYVEYVLHRIRMLQHYGITPYVVFDGNYLPSKAGTEAKRAQSRADAKRKGLELLRLGQVSEAHQELQRAIDVTPEMAKNLIEELKKLKIEYIVAPYEADAQLAYLEREGVIQGILSEDSDLLVFGAKKLITKLDKFGECVEIRREDLTSCRTVSFVGWTDDMFRRMAILTGCDYLDGLQNMGLKTAHSLIRRHKDLDRVLRVIAFDGKIRLPKDYAESFRTAEFTFLHQWVFCPTQQKLVMGTPWAEDLRPANIDFIGENLDVSIAIGVATGQLHPMTKLPLQRHGHPQTANQNARPGRYGMQRSQTLATPEVLKGQKKPIDSFFKPRRTPLAELDPNCFTPSPSQDELLRRHPGTVATTPVDENNSPTVSFASITTTSQSTSRARPSRDPLGLATGPRSAPQPAKRKRLCDDSPKKNRTIEANDKEPSQSRFFSTKVPESSPSLKRQTRQKLKTGAVSIHCDGLADREPVALPDPTDTAPPKTPKLSIFRDSGSDLVTPVQDNKDTQSDSQSSVSSLAVSVFSVSSTLTEATSASFDSPCTPSVVAIDDDARTKLNNLQEKFTFIGDRSSKRQSVAQEPSAASKSRPSFRESALQRLGRQAIQRSQSLPNFATLSKQSSNVAKGSFTDDANDMFDEPSSLPNWSFGSNTTRAAAVAKEVSALPGTQGSEDMVVPNSEDDIPEGDDVPTATPVNLGRFVFDGR